MINPSVGVAACNKRAEIFFVFVAQQQQRVIDALQHRHRILLEQAREIAALLHGAVERSVLFDDQNGR